MCIIDTVFAVSKQVDDNRDLPRVLLSLNEEVGELAQEVKIKLGYSYKEPSEDGVLGEAVDALICILDMLYTADPSITTEQIQNLVKSKTDKWLEKHRLMKG